MNTRRLVTVILFLAIFAMAARISVDTDTWWHLRAGAWMIENRTIPQVDPFSYTRGGLPWEYPGWLVEAPMLGIFRAFGPGGLNLWTALMVTAAFGFIWKTLSGGPFLRAFVLVLAAAASAVYWAARPYLVTFLFAAIYLYILEQFHYRKRGTAVLGWLPVLMVLWANSHGGFAVGIILWGVYWVAESVHLMLSRKFWPLPYTWLQITGTGLLLIVAIAINPSGIGMLAYPFKTVSIGALQDYIQEWQTPNFHSLQVQPFAWLLFVTLGAIGFSRRRLALTDFLLVVGLAYMGLMAARNVALFSLAAPMVITRHISPVLAALGRKHGYHGLPEGHASRKQTVLNATLVGLLGLAVIVKLSLVYPYQPNQKYFQDTFPAGAVEYIQAHHPPGRLFNSYNWGGYLLWTLPDYPVFIDGRTDLYNDEIISQWLQVVRAETGWEGVLDRWQVRLILIEPGMPVVGKLEAYGWQKVYEDELGIVFTR